jgi:hypothetical protein
MPDQVTSWIGNWNRGSPDFLGEEGSQGLAKNPLKFTASPRSEIQLFTQRWAARAEMHLDKTAKQSASHNFRLARKEVSEKRQTRFRWDEKAGLRGMRYAPDVRRARGTMKRNPAMKKTSTVPVNGNMIFKGHKLTIGVDLGDRWSCYCVFDGAGEILLEQKVATTGSDETSLIRNANIRADAT